jgi:hypothetical protein
MLGRKSHYVNVEKAAIHNSDFINIRKAYRNRYDNNFVFLHF